MTDSLQAKRYLVSGFVQGIGFRYFTQRAAERLKVHGYVRNLSDGRVEAYAIGTTEQLAEFRTELQRGPMAANVMKVAEVEDVMYPQYAKDFVITYDV